MGWRGWPRQRNPMRTAEVLGKPSNPRRADLPVAETQICAAPTTAERENQALRLHWGGPLAISLCSAATLYLVVWTYRQFIARPWLPLWDESFYYPTAVQIWHSLRAWDLHAVGWETWNYHLANGNPFLGPYFLVLGMMIGGPSLEAARITSLVAGFLGWGGIAWLAATLAGERKAYAAAIAGALWGTSPMFLYYSSRAYYESFTLMLTAFCFVAAARFARNGSRRAALATGSLASLTFLTKYNAGLLIFVTVFLGIAWPEIRKRMATGPRKMLEPLTRPWVLLAATALVPVAAWWMAGEVRLFARFMAGYPYDAMDLSHHLLFFPRSFFYDYVSLPAIGILILAGLAYWAVRGWTEPGVRVVWLYIALNGMGAALHTMKDGRLIWSSVALSAALAGAFLAREIPRLPRRLNFAAGAVLVLALLASLWAAPAAAQEFFSRVQPAPKPAQQRVLKEALNFIRENTAPGQTIFVEGMADRGVTNGLVKQFLWEANQQQEPDLESLPYPGFPATWGYSPQPSPLYAELLEKGFAQKPDASLVVLEHDPGSPWRGRMYPWIFAWEENYGHAAESSNDLEVVAKLDTHAGLRVTIYRRRTKDTR